MRNRIVAMRYAGALERALEQGELEHAADALNSVAELFNTHHDLHSALANPSIPIEKREEVLRDVTTRLELETAVKKLMHELFVRGRIALLPDIAIEFMRLADERLGRVAAEVTSARPLTDSQEQELRAALAKRTGKNVRLVIAVDPELIGGVVARVGGEIIDGSLRTRLGRLEEDLIAQDV
jgi:F-type H+-transporting ATPase subunit delta